MMKNLAALANAKAQAFTNAIKLDNRWQLQDELMCQVFGFTMYGYVFGVARTICFMDVPDIQKLATAQLTDLGVGAQYAAGMMQAAHQEMMQVGNSSLHNQLIGIGHSHFGDENLTALVDSVFQNTLLIRNPTN